MSMNLVSLMHSLPNMTMKTALYRVEEEGTNGWFQVDDYQGLTKEQATQVLNQLFQEGHNPEHIRVVREN